MLTELVIFNSGLLMALIFYCAAGLLYKTNRHQGGNLLLLAGLGVHILSLILRGYIEGQWYIDPVSEEAFIIPLVIGCIAFLLLRKEISEEGLLIIVPLILFSLLAFLLPKFPLQPSLKIRTFFAPAFFVTEVISAGLFISAAAIAIATLASKINTVTYSRLLLWGFVIFTLCQIVGALWAYIGWSHPFSWSNRHLVSTSVWCLYAALIHAHLIKIPPPLKAVCTISGLIPVLYMTYGHEITNFLRFIKGAAA